MNVLDQYRTATAADLPTIARLLQSGMPVLVRSLFRSDESPYPITDISRGPYNLTAEGIQGFDRKSSPWEMRVTEGRIPHVELRQGDGIWFAPEFQSVIILIPDLETLSQELKVATWELEVALGLRAQKECTAKTTLEAEEEFRRAATGSEEEVAAYARWEELASEMVRQANTPYEATVALMSCPEGGLAAEEARRKLRRLVFIAIAETSTVEGLRAIRPHTEAGSRGRWRLIEQMAKLTLK